ncbi:MAG: NAD-dependent epimerase/dehydratase family protein, partial [Chloroflexi bacterium]|nr:NAD-dependent epimerase/dehydratase family protein [Chloroflexota bacterium]
MTPAVLVTGCAGFIGAKVVERLLNDGNTVVGVDNLNEAYDVRLKKWRLQQFEDRSGFRYQNSDILDLGALADIFTSRVRSEPPFKTVIHLAARAGVRQSIETPNLYFDTNVTGTLNLLRLSSQSGVEKFILASSSSVYGMGNGNPQGHQESDDTNHPLSPYAASKKAAEALSYSYHFLNKLDITALRYFSVYGPAGRPDMSPFRFIKWISEGQTVNVFGDGSQSRDFTYVDDIVDGTLAAMKPVGYEVINLGSDSPVALNDLIEIVERTVGKKAIVVRGAKHPADVDSTWANIKKA